MFIVARGIESACAYILVCNHIEVYVWAYECVRVRLCVYVCMNAISLSMYDASETRQSRKRLPKIFAKCVNPNVCYARLTCSILFLWILLSEIAERVYGLCYWCACARAHVSLSCSLSRQYCNGHLFEPEMSTIQCCVCPIKITEWPFVRNQQRNGKSPEW